MDIVQDLENTLSSSSDTQEEQLIAWACLARKLRSLPKDHDPPMAPNLVRQFLDRFCSRADPLTKRWTGVVLLELTRPGWPSLSQLELPTLTSLSTVLASSESREDVRILAAALITFASRSGYKPVSLTGDESIVHALTSLLPAGPITDGSQWLGDLWDILEDDLLFPQSHPVDSQQFLAASLDGTDIYHDGNLHAWVDDKGLRLCTCPFANDLVFVDVVFSDIERSTVGKVTARGRRLTCLTLTLKKDKAIMVDAQTRPGKSFTIYDELSAELDVIEFAKILDSASNTASASSVSGKLDRQDKEQWSPAKPANANARTKGERVSNTDATRPTGSRSQNQLSFAFELDELNEDDEDNGAGVKKHEQQKRPVNTSTTRDTGQIRRTTSQSKGKMSFAFELDESKEDDVDNSARKAWLALPKQPLSTSITSRMRDETGEIAAEKGKLNSQPDHMNTVGAGDSTDRRPIDDFELDDMSGEEEEQVTRKPAKQRRGASKPSTRPTGRKPASTTTKRAATSAAAKATKRGKTDLKPAESRRRSTRNSTAKNKSLREESSDSEVEDDLGQVVFRGRANRVVVRSDGTDNQPSPGKNETQATKARTSRASSNDIPKSPSIASSVRDYPAMTPMAESLTGKPNIVRFDQDGLRDNGEKQTQPAAASQIDMVVPSTHDRAHKRHFEGQVSDRAPKKRQALSLDALGAEESLSLDRVASHHELPTGSELSRRVDSNGSPYSTKTRLPTGDGPIVAFNAKDKLGALALTASQTEMSPPRRPTRQSGGSSSERGDRLLDVKTIGTKTSKVPRKNMNGQQQDPGLLEQDSSPSRVTPSARVRDAFHGSRSDLDLDAKVDQKVMTAKELAEQATVAYAKPPEVVQGRRASISDREHDRLLDAESGPPAILMQLPTAGNVTVTNSAAHAAAESTWNEAEETMINTSEEGAARTVARLALRCGYGEDEAAHDSGSAESDTGSEPDESQAMDFDACSEVGGQEGEWKASHGIEDPISLSARPGVRNLVDAVHQAALAFAERLERPHEHAEAAAVIYQEDALKLLASTQQVQESGALEAIDWIRKRAKILERRRRRQVAELEKAHRLMSHHTKEIKAALIRLGTMHHDERLAMEQMATVYC